MGTMFSGSAVVDWSNTSGLQKGSEKVLVAIYTAAGGTSDQSKGKAFTQCLAYSNDAGQSWTKYDKNPILAHIRGGNRDPKIVWHEPTKRWIMALFLDGSDFCFFSSPDLKNWKKLHEITVAGCGECPDFFPMKIDGDDKTTKWVWTPANGHYLVGDFDGEQFKPDPAVAQTMDYGKHYYAVQSYSDIPQADGRRIQIAWMNNPRLPRMPFHGQMSFPRELKLKRTRDGIRLFNVPVKEIDSLHAKTHRFSDTSIKPGENLLSNIRGDFYEIRA